MAATDLKVDAPADLEALDLLKRAWRGIAHRHGPQLSSDALHTSARADGGTRQDGS